MSKIIEFKTLPEYFDFFEAIPEEKWGTGTLEYNGKSCALGLLGYTDLNESSQTNIFNQSMQKFEPHWGAWAVNDNRCLRWTDLGDTPKERILNAIILKESGIMDDLNPQEGAEG